MTQRGTERRDNFMVQPAGKAGVPSSGCGREISYLHARAGGSTFSRLPLDPKEARILSANSLKNEQSAF